MVASFLPFYKVLKIKWLQSKVGHLGGVWSQVQILSTRQPSKQGHCSIPRLLGLVSFLSPICSKTFKNIQRRSKKVVAEWSHLKNNNMAQVKLYYRDKYNTLTLQFSNAGKTARYSLPVHILPEQWDGQRVTSAHNRAKELNLYLTSILSKAQMILMRIQENEPTKTMPAMAIRDKVCAELFNSSDEAAKAGFIATYKQFTDKHANTRTREIYMITLTRIREYDPSDLQFEDITQKWLTGFDEYMALKSPSKNARAIHMRNIRAVFNYAINQEITDAYPFRRFRIKYDETEHRDLTLEELQRLFAYEPPTERANKHHSKPLNYAVKYMDAAKLMFYLIGINIIDLWHLSPADYYGGRIRYKRHKTGTMYDIKVEPEAAAIIEKYQGTIKLLSFCETQDDYKNLASQINKALRKISAEMGLPPVTTYWLRHSWATIAYTDACVPIDTISDALGHKNGQKVTLGYVDKLRAMRMCDEANRKVIDIVTKKHHPLSQADGEPK